MTAQTAAAWAQVAAASAQAGVAVAGAVRGARAAGRRGGRRPRRRPQAAPVAVPELPAAPRSDPRLWWGLGALALMGLVVWTARSKAQGKAR
jgi:hypothetical protein